MRSFHDEYNSRKACNDADPRATVRQRVHGIYLTAPLDAEAGAEVQTGLYADRSYVESSGEAAEIRLCFSEQLYITSTVYSDCNHPIRVLFCCQDGTCKVGD